MAKPSLSLSQRAQEDMDNMLTSQLSLRHVSLCHFYRHYVLEKDNYTKKKINFADKAKSALHTSCTSSVVNLLFLKNLQNLNEQQLLGQSP